MLCIFHRYSMRVEVKGNYMVKRKCSGPLASMLAISTSSTASQKVLYCFREMMLSISLEGFFVTGIYTDLVQVMCMYYTHNRIIIMIF